MHGAEAECVEACMLTIKKADIVVEHYYPEGSHRQ